ncbi:hypothetical protein COD05_16025 [Bacillus cereus]|jgi:hypothetical protein|uniref:hypothetical protein n=1 Tax=Bacillus cereus group TaxID=86661 RepID=UPI000BF3EB0A|nr:MULTISPECIES: hypothetical protein [Bacillus cereus group]MCC2496568.1 hypothetical protein [Bacillus cereus]MEB9082744.1 hypothetical protein [Bacillus cereus]MED2684061.1 hypothetical protein [Bacillus thuringiensis]PES26583.1 hypothetical protein CN493_29620 [Bacillus thuringiensis]PFM04644.1 hypothetical protein COJ40_27165 [Bacillus cereus]
MPKAIIEGQYLSSSIKKSSFNGVEKSFVQLDVYQPESTDNEKTVVIKCDDLEVLNKFKETKMGTPIKANVSINAYQNKAYFKLIDIA